MVWEEKAKVQQKLARSTTQGVGNLSENDSKVGLHRQQKYVKHRRLERLKYGHNRVSFNCHFFLPPFPEMFLPLACTCICCWRSC